MSFDPSGLLTRLDRAEASARNAEAQTALLTVRLARSERRFRVAGGVLAAAIAIVIAPTVSPAVAQGYGVTLASLNTRLTTAETAITGQQAAIEALQTKTASMSVLSDPATNQPTVRFSGVNVQVVSGGGGTEAPANGLGNLIVGYNEARSSGNVRTGSHNLVVGVLNNYSSVGGVVFGYLGNISNLEPSVLGGQGNTASGNGSCVAGGVNITQDASAGFSAGGYGGVGTYHTP